MARRGRPGRGGADRADRAGRVGPHRPRGPSASGRCTAPSTRRRRRSTSPRTSPGAGAARRSGVATALAGAAVTGVSGYLGGHLTTARKVGSRDPAFARDEVGPPARPSSRGARPSRGPGPGPAHSRDSPSSATASSSTSATRDRATGEVVVLLHGFPQDSRCWAEVAPVLHRAGLRTLAPDQRGYSPGPRGPTDVSAYRVSALAADVLAVLDAAGVRQRARRGTRLGWCRGLAPRRPPRRPGRVAHGAVDAPPERAGPVDDPLAAAAAQLVHRWRCRCPCSPSWCSRARSARRCACPACRAPRRAVRRRLDRPVGLRGPLAWYRAAARRPAVGAARALGAGAAT